MLRPIFDSSTFVVNKVTTPLPYVINKNLFEPQKITATRDKDKKRLFNESLATPFVPYLKV